MIHTKSLIRRLDCVPWLLTACFVLAWAGETHAQAGAALLDVAPTANETDTIVLELDTRDIYEYDFTKATGESNIDRDHGHSHTS